MVKLETTHYILGAGVLVAAGGLYLAFRNQDGNGGDHRFLSNPTFSLRDIFGIRTSVRVTNPTDEAMSYVAQVELRQGGEQLQPTKENSGTIGAGSAFVETIDFFGPLAPPGARVTAIWRLYDDASPRNKLDEVRTTITASRIMMVTGKTASARVQRKASRRAPHA